MGGNKQIKASRKLKWYLLEVGLIILILRSNPNNLAEMIYQPELPCVLLVDFLHKP